MFKYFKYFLPIFFFSFLCAELDLTSLNESIVDAEIKAVDIIGNSKLLQKVNIIKGEKNKIEITKKSKDIILTENCINFYIVDNKLVFNLLSLKEIKGFVEYNLVLKKMPSVLNVINCSHLKCEEFYSNLIDISVKNYSSVFLKGIVEEQLIEIDNTSKYDAKDLKTKKALIDFEDFSEKPCLDSKIIINVSDFLNIFNQYKTFVTILYEKKPKLLETAGFYIYLKTFDK